MLITPAYMFTLLSGIRVLSLVGCITLAIFCYRLTVDRHPLPGRPEQREMRHPSARLQLPIVIWEAPAPRQQLQKRACT
jgi:hypothetical protein